MRAVLWDLDDTVLDTLAGRIDALAGTCEDFLGRRPDARELWREHGGRTVDELARALVGDEWPRFVERYRARDVARDVAPGPFPGVVEALDALGSDGLELAIVTSKRTANAREELVRTGLLDRFAAVVGWEDSERHKPDPEPLLVAMRHLGLDEPGCVAYVGDTPADVRAARAAGCRSVGAAWGSLDAERVREARPHAMAERPADVVAYVRRLVPAATTCRTHGRRR